MQRSVTVSSVKVAHWVHVQPLNKLDKVLGIYLIVISVYIQANHRSSLCCPHELNFG